MITFQNEAERNDWKDSFLRVLSSANAAPAIAAADGYILALRERSNQDNKFYNLSISGGISDGQKINLIKALREIFNWSLKDSKQVSDIIHAGQTFRATVKTAQREKCKLLDGIVSYTLVD